MALRSTGPVSVCSSEIASDTFLEADFMNPTPSTVISVMLYTVGTVPFFS